MIQTLTPLNTKVTPKAWRRKWMKVVDGKDTNEYFYTWHDSDEDADLFVGTFFQQFNGIPPKDYYRPIGHAQEKLYDSKVPKGDFIKVDAITLAP